MIAGAVGDNQFCLGLNVVFGYLVSYPKLVSETVLWTSGVSLSFQ